MKVCVVVPVYKDFKLLTNEELTSLHRLFKVLGEYEIFFAGPENLQYEPFLKEGQKQNVFITVKRFSNEYFNGVEGYNRLMISSLFYQRFKQFKYLLIYQLDAYVFRDELEYWCDKGYDYIGAPWSAMHYYLNNSLEGVGNGGFSLRKIKSAIKLLNKIRMNELLQQYKGYNWKGLMPKLPSIIKKLEEAKKTPSKCEENYHFQEDYFWCNVGPAALVSSSCRSNLLKLLFWIYTRNDYKIAPKNIAVSFSLETNAREFFKNNNEKVPFGCHAWEKYEPDFWKQFIAINELVK